MTKRAFVAFAFSCALICACDDEKSASRDASVFLDGNSADVSTKRDTLMDVAADAPSCATPNPSTVCKANPDDCVPSGCLCIFGLWGCTADCAGGRACSDAGANPDAAANKDASAAADLCTSTGGTVQNTLCCNGTAAFPNSCNVGACGCGPQSSRDVATCACPSKKCFDSSRGCVARSL